MPPGSHAIAAIFPRRNHKNPQTVLAVASQRDNLFDARRLLLQTGSSQRRW